MPTYEILIRAEVEAPETAGRPETALRPHEIERALVSTSSGNGGYAVCAPDKGLGKLTGQLRIKSVDFTGAPGAARKKVVVETTIAVPDTGSDETDVNVARDLIARGLEKAGIAGEDATLRLVGIDKDGPRDVYMVLVNPDSGCVFVKQRGFFEAQGGFRDTWGRRWIPVVASSIEDARRRGCELPGAKPYEQQAPA